MEPITATGVLGESGRKEPDLRAKFWILRKSGFVPTTVAEGAVLSPTRELTEMARGATESILSICFKDFTSSRVKLDFR